MFYTEKLPNNNKSLLKVKLSDFSKGINTKVSENILPLNYAVNTFNYSYSSGALKEGLGLKVLEMPDLVGVPRSIPTPEGVTKIINAWLFRRYDNAGKRFSPYLMIYCDDKKLYYWRVSTYEDLYLDTGLTFNVEPASIPKKQFPLNVLKSALLTLSFSWRFLNSSYSASIEKSGFNGLEVSS